MEMLKKFLIKILGLDQLDYRIRRLEREKYWKEKYIGRSIQGEYGGVNLSNPSSVKYYKGMLD